MTLVNPSETQAGEVFVSSPNHSTPSAPPRVAALTLTAASIQSSLIPYSYAKPLQQSPFGQVHREIDVNTCNPPLTRTRQRILRGHPLPLWD